jgi:potassium-transporting ATPase potassium-binding subunit
MTFPGLLQIVVLLGAWILATKPLGLYMARVFRGERTLLAPLLRPLERLIYRMSGIKEESEQHWTGYACALLAFSLASFALTYAIQRLQGMLPLNPMRFGTAAAPPGSTEVTPDLAFNTAVSFMSNTNWQAYAGEATLSYFVQMAALTVQNFVSAAAGVAVAIAVVRGFARRQTTTLGNFWVDLTRATLYVFLPLSLVFALFLCSQGVIQNFNHYTKARTIEGETQVIAQGPVASQEAIKLIGTNGGGFMNANSAHPYENPRPLTGFIEIFVIFLVSAGLTCTFGEMVGDMRQGWALFAVMSLLFLTGVFAACYFEQSGNPILGDLGLETCPTSLQPGGNMEGKEVRFGIISSALFATVTTDASCGAVNSMHDSYTPLGGLVPLFNMMTGEVIFGGTGAGLYGMLLFAVLAVFIAGLMVGRTPEYLGKKIEAREVKMAMLALIAMAASILAFSAAGSVVSLSRGGYWNWPGPAVANLNNGGPHGLSEIIYAYTSGTANNGSAFAGINANTPWYNITTGAAMLIGRFLVIVPLLAMAGSLAAKKSVPVSTGTLLTHGVLFVGLLTGTVLIVGALTFFPALSLGPIVEHFLMMERHLFSSVFIALPVG